MSPEVKYIIKNKKFKATWKDQVNYFEFIAPLLFLVYGLDLIILQRNVEGYFFGSLSVIASVLLTKFLVVRRKQLNEFEEIPSKRPQEENWNVVLSCLKEIRIVQIETDPHNWTISAKYKSELVPPVFEWLTIVCRDNRILVNSRPVPPSMIAWLRRNAMIDFKRVFQDASR